ncbi:class I SAM-dependent methyltransferase [Microbacteriaceae bacterium 4G12]
MKDVAMNDANVLSVILEVHSMLEEANVPYQFVDEASLWLQGVEVSLQSICVTVQWDLFEKVYDLCKGYTPSLIEKTALKASFSFQKNAIPIHINCYFNTTIKTDPYRIFVYKEVSIPCRSLYAYLYFPESTMFSDDIHRFLLREQQAFAKQNELAWNQNNYTALINRYGEPETVAKKIIENPKWRLYPFYKYMGDVSRKKVLHLMGSNGVKATALSMLGAEVTVVDFSQENAAFAKELAAHANVAMEYIVSDILSFGEMTDCEYDMVLMELGVLHYFIDIQPLVRVIKKLLRPGGQWILHEFHPISTKLITSTGKKHKVTGNYFDPSIESGHVAFSKHMSDEERQSLTNVFQRKWTLGELITSTAQEGLTIKVLEEEPNHKLHDIGLPKTFTLISEK